MPDCGETIETVDESVRVTYGVLVRAHVTVLDLCTLFPTPFAATLSSSSSSFWEHTQGY
jgi:hypothetical protein